MNAISRCITLCAVGGLIVFVLLRLPAIGESIAQVTGVLSVPARSAPAPTISPPRQPDTSVYQAFRQHDRAAACQQIEREFGIRVDPEQFGSHHAARGYLARLRLAKRARAVGIDVDPHAFGDVVFMARHIEHALRERGIMDFASEWTAGPDGSAFPSDADGDREYIFFRGHRYRRNHAGQYVRGDGRLLAVPRSRSTGRPEPAVPGPPTADSLDFDPAMPDLQTLLDLLESYQLDAAAD